MVRCIKIGTITNINFYAANETNNYPYAFEICSNNGRFVCAFETYEEWKKELEYIMQIWFNQIEEKGGFK